MARGSRPRRPRQAIPEALAAQPAPRPELTSEETELYRQNLARLPPAAAPAAGMVGGVVSPPIQHVGHFSPALNMMEIMITIGVTRLGFGEPTSPPISGVEWISTLQMSPTTAKILRDGLVDLVKSYESAYGKIPGDPNFKLPSLVAPTLPPPPKG